MGKHSDFPPLCSNTKRVKRALYILYSHHELRSGIYSKRERTACFVLLALFLYIRSQLNASTLCVWLHSGNVTCNFSPYANQACFPARDTTRSLIKSGIVQLSAVINQSALFKFKSYTITNGSSLQLHYSFVSHQLLDCKAAASIRAPFREMFSGVHTEPS